MFYGGLGFRALGFTGPQGVELRTQILVGAQSVR